jgi:pimeloyl-ACP methyl ester carboxylesterase
VNVDGIDLHVEVMGDGPLLVLVHGSWTDATSWAAIVPMLARGHRVAVYDRRGHSRSAAGDRPGTRRDDEDDLIALIEALGGPAFVVGSSFGGLIGLAVAARRPDLVRGLQLHEPPAVHADPAAVADVLRLSERVVAEIAAGEHERAARRFVEEAVLGPGGWEMLPPEGRAAIAGNAPTYAEEQADPGWADVDRDAIERFPGPVTITAGTVTPGWLPALAEGLAHQLGRRPVRRIDGAGHAPHLSHPAEYAELIAANASRASDARAAA